MFYMFSPALKLFIVALKVESGLASLSLPGPMFVKA